MAHGLGYGVRARAEGRSEGSMLSLPREVDSWGGRGGGRYLAALQAQNHKLSRLRGRSVQSPGSGRCRWGH